MPVLLFTNKFSNIASNVFIVRLYYNVLQNFGEQEI
jgi:hypothetical protein